MTDDLPTRDTVIERYSGLAQVAMAGGTPLDCSQDSSQDGCFGAAAYDEPDVPEAAMRASLGCGNPVAVAALKQGETVLDLGSGGGLDVLLSARRVGPYGKAYGLDASEGMLALARETAAAAGATNVKFLKGHIEKIPLSDATVDVIISNCVVNLSGDKPAVIAEAFRVLKPGGRLGISDVIAAEGLDPDRRSEKERRIGCSIGTLTASEYEGLLRRVGFTAATITSTTTAGEGLSSAIIQACKPSFTVRSMRPEDAAAVLAIYQAGLDTGDASFEITAPTWEAFDAAKHPDHRHVALDPVTGDLLGWIAVSSVSRRAVYEGVVEHSVYVHPDAQGRGVGSALLDALIASTEAAGIWTIQSGIFPENAASRSVHERAGFRVVGIRVRVGKHYDRWRDVIAIERRSALVGID
jgi:L-amino acid N-acyltransferase YncA/2-polyprenyl-3-methyl-5-hydroxy-6-metoxy-1,4-benzoquinol methylase